MAIRTIRTDDDPVLRKISRKVENFDDRLFLILEDMKDTLIKSQGIGLAAVQIGILRRIVYFEMNTKIKNPNPTLKEKVFKYEDLLLMVRAAYALESKWENEDWFDYFRLDTHKYLMKNNSFNVIIRLPYFLVYLY